MAAPTAEESEVRSQVIAKVTNVIKSLWPHATVDIFGSYRTNLYLPSCDIDLVVFGKWPTKPLFTLKDALVAKNVTTEENARVIDKATVPIIKIIDTSSNIKVDIAFNTANGLNSADQISKFVSTYPSAKPLILLMKHYLAQRDLNEVYSGGVSSYGLMLMIISFLQLHARGDGLVKDANLGVLLLEFLEHYGCHVNYHKVGIEFLKADNSDDIPQSQYFRRPEQTAYNTFSLPIMDPCSPENDIMRGSFNLFSVQMAFKHSFKVLTNEIYIGNVYDDEDEDGNRSNEDEQSNNGKSTKHKLVKNKTTSDDFYLLSKIMDIRCR
ncbi:hypothetical protein HELRODRAFT_79937 [Helobdella robusta]|uniref:polynucleotide adenylyltransferase n=1 Tax=Helobdella robusta TaxID=6412 RepID=T1G3V3_HELRO|nr:hypothetical protein HELRODRAFT_79937 [Helobdella robusta]ESO03725.1 hypothetical protein HELRODRAFT_79937 [Helobdella robusta]